MSAYSFDLVLSFPEHRSCWIFFGHCFRIFLPTGFHHSSTVFGTISSNICTELVLDSLNIHSIWSRIVCQNAVAVWIWLWKQRCPVCEQLVVIAYYFRCSRVWRSGSLHPGPVRGQEQVNNQRNLLPHDVRNWHAQHPVRVRRSHGRHHRQQLAQLRPLLNHKHKRWLRNSSQFFSQCTNSTHHPYLQQRSEVASLASLRSNCNRL